LASAASKKDGQDKERKKSSRSGRRGRRMPEMKNPANRAACGGKRRGEKEKVKRNAYLPVRIELARLA